MTKEEGELRIALDLVRGALVDACNVDIPTNVLHYGAAVRKVIDQRNEFRKQVIKLERKIIRLQK